VKRISTEVNNTRARIFDKIVFRPHQISDITIVKMARSHCLRPAVISLVCIFIGAFLPTNVHVVPLTSSSVYDLSDDMRLKGNIHDHEHEIGSITTLERLENEIKRLSIPKMSQVRDDSTDTSAKSHLAKKVELNGKNESQVKTNNEDKDNDDSNALPKILFIGGAILTILFLAIVVMHVCRNKDTDYTGPPRATVSLFAD